MMVFLEMNRNGAEGCRFVEVGAEFVDFFRGWVCFKGEKVENSFVERQKEKERESN
jgi:hypothetical protein